MVLRKDIDEIASTGVSLMPDGLEKAISVQEMADLLGSSRIGGIWMDRCRWESDRLSFSARRSAAKRVGPLGLVPHHGPRFG